MEKIKKVGTSLEDLLSLTQPSIQEKKDEVEVFSQDMALKIIPIEKFALEKLFMVAEETTTVCKRDLESYAYLMGDEETGVVKDILIPKQRVSGAYVSINEVHVLEIKQFIEEYQKNKKIRLSVLGWGHSHANMSVFFSGTDNNNQKTIFTGTSNYKYLPESPNTRVKYCYGMTVNLRRQTYGEITTQFPDTSLHTIQSNFNIIGDYPKDWDEGALRKNIRNELEDKVLNKNQAFGARSWDNSYSSSD